MTVTTTNTLILGQEMFPASPSFGKFALEFTKSREAPGYFHLFFNSGSAQNLCILSGDVHEVEGRLQFLPCRREGEAEGQHFHDQRIKRLLNAFAKEANSRLLLATLEVDEALDAADECIASNGKF